MAIRAVLLDLDGTIYQQGRALPGAVDAVRALRARGLLVRFVTNTTSRPRRVIAERCRSYGFQLEAGDIATALLAGVRYLEREGLRRVLPVVTDAAREDLAGLEPTDSDPQAVLIGDIDPAWSTAILNRAFRHVLNGARLVALSKDRYWLADDGLRLDCGAFVAALEYATGAPAVLCGKPSAEFYRAALEPLGVRPGEALMVGDDLWGDIDGAQQAGLKAFLVRTGKFRQDVLDASGVRPDFLLGSVAELTPEALLRA